MSKIFLMMVALAVGALLSASVYSAEQGGTLLEEPQNALRETQVKHMTAFLNFTYILDGDNPSGDTWNVYDGYKKFAGDCEDFAFTLQRMVGAGNVHYVMTYDSANIGLIPDHAVFIHSGVVWELNGQAYLLVDYQAQVGRILWHYGDITPELK